jgi:linoleoyl-CoA desaturase
MAIKFNKNRGDFTRELKEAVNAYFAEKNIAHTGNLQLYFKTIFWTLVTAGLYIVLICFTPTNGWFSLALCALMGLSFACIGFNIMHDAGHKSYSKRKWVNTLFAHSLNVLGANANIWERKHNIAHHTYTNIEEYDDDIIVSPLLCLHPNQKRYWWYKFQFVYMWILYAFEYLGWITVFDIKKYFTAKAAQTNIPMNVWQKLLFWVSKVLYGMIFIGIPMYQVGVIPVLIGYLTMAGVCGIVISIIFQLAHIQEKVSFPIPVPVEGKEGVSMIEEEIFLHQISTTADFAINNKIVTWFVGGLNFQVEHHLFPLISHVHYPDIHRILKDLCRKHGIKLNVYSTLRSAIWAHIKYMTKIGWTPQVTP